MKGVLLFFLITFVSVCLFGQNVGINNINPQVSLDINGALSKTIKNEIIFVFVTPRLFSNSESVKKELKTKSEWKEIVFIDALTLEQWIDACPVVGEWMAKELMQKYPDTVIGLKTY